MAADSVLAHRSAAGRMRVLCPGLPEVPPGRNGPAAVLSTGGPNSVE
jgi:hypothetical protein